MNMMGESQFEDLSFLMKTLQGISKRMYGMENTRRVILY
jgi:hypothetical protein